jgi:hypothetical protein
MRWVVRLRRWGETVFGVGSSAAVSWTSPVVLPSAGDVANCVDVGLGCHI